MDYITSSFFPSFFSRHIINVGPFTVLERTLGSVSVSTDSSPLYWSTRTITFTQCTCNLEIKEGLSFQLSTG